MQQAVTNSDLKAYTFSEGKALVRQKVAQHSVLRNCLGGNQLEAKLRSSLLYIFNLLGFVLSLVFVYI